ncbi:hypothetical protein [Microseira wollei]|uniref:hypothetical protein n=1 Tax=Microseira wollei TaxID=467598 RepID=UPI001CFE5FE6|nr:hypothetical protein [Microseira wollei]
MPLRRLRSICRQINRGRGTASEFCRQSKDGQMPCPYDYPASIVGRGFCFPK